MVSMTRTEIAAILEPILRRKTKAELIQDKIDSVAIRVRRTEDVTRRRTEGRRGKTEPKKIKVREIHAAMKAKLGRNPPWNSFFRTLDTIYPDENWSYDTVNGWWKNLNAGRSI